MVLAHDRSACRAARCRQTLSEPPPPRRTWQVLAVVVALLGLCAQPGYASSAINAPYLGGVSGPRPAKSVDVAGTWDFQTVQTTTCTPPAVPVGPQPCVNGPSSEHTTIQVPDGGWVK